MNFTQFSIATLHLIHADIAGLIGVCQLPAPLNEAALYAMTNGGKRVRPLLVASTFLTLHPTLRKTLATTSPHDYYLPSSVRRAMIAVECLHGYSLVHDDLPCMDDDALRRGRPTTHLAYDEATALLAGDVLQTLAFEAFSHYYFGNDEFPQHLAMSQAANAEGLEREALEKEGLDSEGSDKEPPQAAPPLQLNTERVSLSDDILSSKKTASPASQSLAIASLAKPDDTDDHTAELLDASELSDTAHTAGISEPADLPLPVDKTAALLAIFAPRARRMVMGQMLDLKGESQQLTQEELEAVHTDKTGALIEASVLMGAECGSANAEQMLALQAFAQNIGLAFQVQDDILDVTATTEELGKPSGSDEKLDKSTYVKLLGVEEATIYAATLFNNATTALRDQFGDDNLLMDLANWLWARQK